MPCTAKGSLTMMTLFDPMQTLKISSLLWHGKAQALLKQEAEQIALLEPFAIVSSVVSFASSVCMSLSEIANIQPRMFNTIIFFTIFIHIKRQSYSR